MIIEDWESSKYLNPTYKKLREAGLETNIAELEAFGFTMIENALTPDEVERTKEVIIKVAERRWDRKIDIHSATSEGGGLAGTPILTNLLFEDLWIEELLMRPLPLLIITYLLGQSVKLNSVTSHIKAGGADGLRLHTDTSNGVANPLPFYSSFGNLTYALTDYSREGGALAMVPGSHRWCRRPTPDESVMRLGEENPLAVPITPKAGTAIIWHGNLWHGAFARQSSGVRMNLIFAFCRQFMETQEPIQRQIKPDAWERHAGDPVFAGLMGAYNYHGWESDSDFATRYNERAMQAGLDWHS